MAARNKYVIHAFIIRRAATTYAVKARIEPVFRREDGSTIEEEETCDPCEYAEARTTCYKFVAHLAHQIGKAGGEVADVIITDAADLA